MTNRETIGELLRLVQQLMEKPLDLEVREQISDSHWLVPARVWAGVDDGYEHKSHDGYVYSESAKFSPSVCSPDCVATEVLILREDL